MPDYSCPSCGKDAKLPGSSRGKNITRKETNCDKCKAPADLTQDCGDSPMQKS